MAVPCLSTYRCNNNSLLVCSIFVFVPKLQRRLYSIQFNSIQFIHLLLYYIGRAAIDRSFDPSIIRLCSNIGLLFYCHLCVSCVSFVMCHYYFENLFLVDPTFVYFLLLKYFLLTIWLQYDLRRRRSSGRGCRGLHLRRIDGVHVIVLYQIAQGLPMFLFIVTDIYKDVIQGR